MEINAMMDLLKGLRGLQKMKSHFAKEIFLMKRNTVTQKKW